MRNSSLKITFMSLLLQNVHHKDLSGEKDIRIVDGFIEKIAQGIKPAQNEQVINLEGKLVTYGWFDLNADFADPGFEYREDTISGGRLAAQSGFTDICILPYTIPSVDSKGSIEYLKRKSSAVVPTFHAVANLSKGGKGEDLSEMYDLWETGAAYFMDTAPIANAELLLKALEYTQRFNGVVASIPVEQSLARFGLVHEGAVSTSLGLRGIPDVAETAAIKRDLEILSYGGGRLHFAGISCAESVDIIAEAKKHGLQVSCDVAIHNLIFVDEEMPAFDTSFKTQPVLREASDRAALREGLRSGTIDAIASYHQPRSTEEKDLEFDLADFGAISLQTLFSDVLKLSEDLSFDLLEEKLSNGPRRILGMDPVAIKEGKIAKLSVFDKEASWVFDSNSNLSKSMNSPYYNQELKGKCLGIVNGSKTNLS